jgi:hypothetical protein
LKLILLNIGKVLARKKNREISKFWLSERKTTAGKTHRKTNNPFISTKNYRRDISSTGYADLKYGKLSASALGPLLQEKI